MLRLFFLTAAAWCGVCIWKRTCIARSTTLTWTASPKAQLVSCSLQLEENMYRAFHHFDKDGSGTISKEELREALKVGCMPFEQAGIRAQA